MKVMGLFTVTLAVCLVSMTVAQPFFLPAATAGTLATVPAATAGATFTTAGGLVLTDALGATIATIPVATAAAASAVSVPAGLVYAGLAAKKVIAGKLILDAIANRDAERDQPHHH